MRRPDLRLERTAPPLAWLASALRLMRKPLAHRPYPIAKRRYQCSRAI